MFLKCLGKVGSAVSYVYCILHQRGGIAIGTSSAKTPCKAVGMKKTVRKEGGTVCLYRCIMYTVYGPIPTIPTMCLDMGVYGPIP